MKIDKRKNYNKPKKFYEIREVVDNKETHIGYIKARSMGDIAEYVDKTYKGKLITVYPISNFLDKEAIEI